YYKFLKTPFNDIFTALNGKLGLFVVAPVQAFIAFYIINLFTNLEGIYPGTTWFFPLYSMICLTFVVEYVLLFNSVLWSARAMKTSAELDVAKNIQTTSLPHDFNAFPELPDINVYASMNTAKEVGGDFYDFFKIGDHQFAVVIADVSGKGVPAAMFMMRARTIIRSYAETGQPIEEVMTKANASLCKYNDAEMFVTAWAGVIDTETGMLTFANGGHNPRLIRKKDGAFEYLKMKTNFVLGSFDTVRYKRQEYQLEHGDTLYLYTDGVTEAMNVHKQLYGEDRLLNVLNKEHYSTAENVIDAVKVDVADFTFKAEQSDDITMLSVFYN
ncbi:MAG: serine/threonine-protein phosphatase, partial [Firmicutes bacterium]|nr:serine/threonine-protein phosphatase [Candidatus Colimorpha enterica]